MAQPKFLIIKPSSLGDVLHAFPAVNALCRETGGTADWVIAPAFAPLLDYMPCVERRILFERKQLGSLTGFLPAFGRLWKSIRTEKYDAVIDLQGLFRSALIGFMAKADMHAGPEAPREGIAGMFYSRKLPGQPDPAAEYHALVRNNFTVAGFSGLDFESMDFSYSMPEHPQNSADASALLAQAGVQPGTPLLAIAPGARWKTKEWNPEFFAAVVDGLAEKFPDARFPVLGSGTEKTQEEIILQSARAADRLVPLCGKTSMGGLVEMIRRSRLLVCNDSGPMHIAAALRVPVLAFFGPTSPVLTGPWSDNHVVLAPDIPCLRCFKRQCDSMACHKAVPVEEAVENACKLFMKG